MLRVLGDDHYKRMPHVTVRVARLRILTDQWPYVPNIGQNLHFWRVRMSEKFSSGTINLKHKQTNKQKKNRTDR